MAEYTDRKVTHLTGNVGQDPKVYETSKGDVLKLSLAVTLTYGDEGEARWVNLAVWNEDLLEFVKSEISKGSCIAVEGFLKTDREYQGKKQFDLSVTRIGLVSWAKRGSKGSSKPRQEKAAESEELGW